MTKHFKISCATVLIMSLGLWFIYYRLAQQIKDSVPGLAHTSSVLPQNVKERIVYDEKTHMLTVQTKESSVKEYAKTPVVEITKNGEIKVIRHVAGFENEPFLGGGYADAGRIFIGTNYFHFSRFDLIGAIGWTPDVRYSAVQPFVGIGYNLYHNTSLNVSVNPISLAQQKVEIAGFVSIRL